MATQPLKEDQILALFEKIPFFDKFTLEEKCYFAAMDCNVVRFLHNERIIKQGQPDYSLFIILSGAVRVTKDLPPQGLKQTPREAFLTRLKTGSVFGEISLLAKRPRASNAYADGDTIVLKLEGELLEQMDPVLQNKINRQLIELLILRLEDMNRQMMQFTH